MARFAFGLSAVMVASIAMAAGCSTADDASDDATQDVIGGVDATSAEYDAIGEVLIVGNDHTQGICTGTLIAPNVVLTARHCAMATPLKEGSPTHIQDGKVYFLVGANSKHPSQYAQATAVETSNIFHGGFTSLGSDVALYTLGTPITGIEPLQVAATPPTDVNATYLAIGYGIQDMAGHTGTRKMGNVTLRAVSGAPAPLAFATADDFVTFRQQGNPTALTDAQKDQIKQSYLSPMSSGYEVYAGGAAGDSQICHGDSGGPLLSKVNGKYVVNGVASTTMNQTGKFCKSGSMYATFGANTRDLIAAKTNDKCATDASNVLACGLTVLPTTCASPALLPDPPAEGAEPTPPTPYVQCLAASCCNEVSDCFGDTACSALSECFSACGKTGGDAPTQQACNTTCYKANSGSYVKYLGYQACGKANCATPAPAHAEAEATN